MLVRLSNLPHCVSTAVLLALSPAAARADVVATYRADFTTSGAPKPGWSYLWNAGGPLGDVANYVPLIRDVSGNWETQANGTWPDAPPGSQIAATPTSLYPGQSASQGGVYDRYAIAAYTFSAADVAANGGMAQMPTYSFAVSATSSNGIQSLIYLNGTYVIGATLPRGFVYDNNSFGSYPVRFGLVRPGDTAYVALGPRGSDTGDRLDLDFSITLSSGLQIIAGPEFPGTTDYYGAEVAQAAASPGIDVGSHSAIVSYGSAQPASYDQYRQWILAGRSGAGGIFTSVPLVPGTNQPAIIAPVDNHLLHLTEFGGQMLPGDQWNQLLLCYTFEGDVNLDGKVTQADYLNVVAHMGQHVTYFEGDADLDGVVTLNDLAIVRDHLGAGVGGSGALAAAASVTAVPEPGIAMMWGIAAMFLCRRRRPPL